MIGWAAVAEAAVIAVPGDASSVDEAVQIAAPGDVIDVAEGFWLDSPVVSVPLTIRGAGTDRTTLGVDAGPIEITGSGAVVFQGLTLDCGGAACVAADGPLTMLDVALVDLGTSAAAVDSRAAVTWVAVAVDGARALSVRDAAVSLDATTIAGGEAALGPVIELAGGTLAATDLAVHDVTATSALSVVDASSVTLTRVVVRCGAFTTSPLDLSGAAVALTAVVVADDTIALADALVRLPSGGTITHGTLVGAGDGVAIDAPTPVDARSTVIADVSEYGAVGGTYDLGWGGTPPPGWSEADPLLRPVDGCAGPVVPDVGSPLVDAGDPSELDRAGGRSDIGATGGPDSFVVDIDGDGVSLDVDCSEYDVGTYPGAPEIPYDGLDQDCDGADTTDVDGDGVDYPTDCDDTDAARAPGLTDIPYDGVDQDCADGDEVDVDDDGAPVGVDCDDHDPARTPGASEVPYDGVDQDCVGGDLTDVDGDGFGRGDDCDDADPTVHPGASEDLGARDADCDGFTDPATPFRPRGCALAPGAGASSWWLVALARRRRR